MYTGTIRKEVLGWERAMLRKPTLFNRFSKRVQTKVNSYIPPRLLSAITSAISGMTKAVLTGARFVARGPQVFGTLEERDQRALQLIEKYKKTASVEGGITGAGGLLLGLADFPILLGIKIKLLYDLAAIYGFDASDYKERVYLLYIFQLAFSSAEHRRYVFLQLKNWEAHSSKLPSDMKDFNWQLFQTEYRDYIDLAKMAQLIPGIGAVVGLVVNYRLVKKLGYTAMQAYRMRILKTEQD